MNDSTPPSLSVSIKELPSVHVACIVYRATGEQDEMHARIGGSFGRVQSWVSERGFDPMAQLTIGAIRMVDGQMTSYECCVQIPDQVQSGSGDVIVQDLPGGRYAVLSMEKNPAIIGPSIGRFHAEYIPQHELEVDGMRPTYEVYYESRMDYCVPIH